MMKRKIFIILFVFIFLFQSAIMPGYALNDVNLDSQNSNMSISLTFLNVTAAEVELVWVSSAGVMNVSSYDIYRDGSIIENNSSFTYTDTGLVSNTSYTYKVKALNETGGLIAESNELTVSTTGKNEYETESATVEAGEGITAEKMENGLSSETLDYRTDRFIIKYKDDSGREKFNKAFEGNIRESGRIANKGNKDGQRRLKENTEAEEENTSGSEMNDMENNNEKNKGRNIEGDSGSNADGMTFDTVEFKSKMKLGDMINEIRSNMLEGSIEYVQPDYTMELLSDDPYYGSQWGLENTGNETSGDISEAYGITIEMILEQLPSHLREAVENNPEFTEFLIDTPAKEMRHRLMTGDVPGEVEPAITMEIAGMPVIMEYIKSNSVDGSSDGKPEKNVQSYLCDAGAAEAWEKTTGSGATIAVIDTGIDISHEDLAENIWVNADEIPDNGIDDDGNGYIDDVNGWNFSGDNNAVYDSVYTLGENHGTHIAGTIAAVKDNKKGIAGVAPSAKIMPLKVFVDGMAYTSDIIKAIQYAEAQGVRIVNCGWGAAYNNPALKEAIEASGMLFVCAAGNHGADIDTSPVYPAAFDCENIITVASVNRYGNLSGFSNYGEKAVDAAAPGEDIYGTLPGDGYGSMSGTSMAAAFGSGEAALLLALDNAESARDLKARIIDYADRLSTLTEKVYGSSMISCVNSLNEIVREEVIYVPGIISTGVNEDLQSDGGVNLYSSIVEGQFIKVSCGDYHSLALRDDGTVWAWGYNYYGQLGDGTRTTRYTAVQVSGLSRITAIAGGGNHSLALKNDGTVWAWGYNEYGQLGNGSATTRYTAAQVSGLSGITAIAGGGNHSLALKNDGTVWAWGYNEYGQLGDGSTTTRYTAVQVSGLSGITAIVGEGTHSLALKSDGTVWACGLNDVGQLGDGTRETTRITAVRVSGVSDVTAIAGGYNHSLALRDNGTVWAWGYNEYGQLGNGKKGWNEYPEWVCGTAVSTSPLTVNVSASCADGKVFDFAIKTANTETLENRTFTITYDPDELEPVDLCSLTQAAELTTGAVNGTNVTINGYSAIDGRITFTVSKVIFNGMSRTGSVNVIRFKCIKTSGTSTITCTLE